MKRTYQSASPVVSIRTLLFVIGFACIWVPVWAADPDELDIVVKRNVPVKMRDGVILPADVHRPDRVGPFPVLAISGNVLVTTNG